MDISLLVTILKLIILILLYLLLGFGPGFIIGLMIANRIFGHGKPLRMDSHNLNLAKAAEHNKQWHPEHEKWKQL